MTQQTKTTVRHIIDRILEMLDDIEKEKTRRYREIGIGRNKPAHISKGIGPYLEYSPAEQQLKNFLMSLNEEQLRKILTLYFVGRDDEKDFYGQYQDSKHHFSSKEDIVFRLLDTQILKDSLLSGQKLITGQNINIEDSFDTFDL